MSGFRGVGGFMVLGVLVAASVSCGGPATPTAPTYTAYNDTFSDGILDQGESISAPDFGPPESLHHFTIHDGTATYPGSVSATITSMVPLNTITVGIGFTTWNATTQNCDLPLAFIGTGAFQVGFPLQASVSVAGDYCVGVYDLGNVLGSTAYTISVDHT